MIAWLFPILATLGVSAAYLLRYRLSGPKLGAVGLYFCVVFNVFFAVPYINIIEKNEFVFLGVRPDIMEDYPFIGWVAFVCVLLHSFALPYKYGRKSKKENEHER